MAGKLVACPSCAEYVRASDSRCPHCDAQVHDGRGHVLGRTAGAVLMGLALTACPSDDDNNETAGSSAGSSSTTAGTNPTTDPTSTTDPGSTTSMTDPSAGITAAAYGNPDTGDESQGTVTEGDTTSSTGGDTDTDTDGTSSGTAGSTSISPDYGVPPTTGE